MGYIESGERGEAGHDAVPVGHMKSVHICGAYVVGRVYCGWGRVHARDKIGGQLAVAKGKMGDGGCVARYV